MSIQLSRGKISANALTVARYAALMAIFSLSISRAAVNVCMGVVTLIVFLHPTFWKSLTRLWALPIVRASLLLFAMILLGILYSTGERSDALDDGSSYRRLLFIPILIWLFHASTLHRRALGFYMAGAIATLLLSTTNYLGWTSFFQIYGPAPLYLAAVFQPAPIAQSVFMAVLLCAAILCAWSAPRARTKYLMAGVAVLTFINLFFMLTSRTGQICVFVVIPWMLWTSTRHLRQQNRKRNLVLLMIGCALFTAMVAGLATRPGSRLNELGHEITDFKHSGTETSAGQRLWFYSMMGTLIQNHPLIGTGTGSLKAETQKLIDQHQTEYTVAIRDPHNQYLDFMAELGVVGLGLFLWLMVAAYRSARELDPLERQFLQATVVIFAVAALFNSSLVDSKTCHMLVFIAGILLAPTLKPVEIRPGLETAKI
jgi:O-antigen ligase